MPAGIEHSHTELYKGPKAMMDKLGQMSTLQESGQVASNAQGDLGCSGDIPRVIGSSRVRTPSTSRLQDKRKRWVECHCLGS